MGVAPEAGEHGGAASMFYDEVLRMAQYYRQPVEGLLATAVAHEMGHVLLPSPGHAPTGIIRAVWTSRDIRHAVLGSLTFTPQQAALIQAKVSGCWSHAKDADLNDPETAGGTSVGPLATAPNDATPRSVVGSLRAIAPARGKPARGAAESHHRWLS